MKNLRRRGRHRLKVEANEVVIINILNIDLHLREIRMFQILQATAEMATVQVGPFQADDRSTTRNAVCILQTESLIGHHLGIMGNTMNMVTIVTGSHLRVRVGMAIIYHMKAKEVRLKEIAKDQTLLRRSAVKAASKAQVEAVLIQASIPCWNPCN